LLLPGDHSKQSCFAGAVWSNHSDDSAWREFEGHVFHQQTVAITFADIVGFDYNVPKSRSGWNVNLQIFTPLFRLFAQHLFIRIYSRLAFGASRLGRHANPFELALQRLLSLALALFFAAKPFLFLLQPRGVVSFPGNTCAAIQFENPTRDVVEEISVVCYRDDCSRITLQVMLQPSD
jgi:hypothetical protein